MATSSAFRDLVSGLFGDPALTVPSNKTYSEILDAHYEQFREDAKKLFAEEHKDLYGTAFMTLEHDIWVNASKNCIIGASCGFIDHNWQPRRLALLALAKNDGHDSVQVARLIEDQLKLRFGLDVAKMARFTISDTAPAARKVSRQFDTTLQTDCAMHALNLCIGYGIGLKENIKSKYVEDPSSKDYVKKKVVVTEGGAFPEGAEVIRKLRNLNNYFASTRSPERIARLADVQKFLRLPQLSVYIDIDVRAASAIKLFQRSIINYPAFQAYFQKADVPKGERNVFSCITEANWVLIVKLEAIIQRVAELALVESRSGCLMLPPATFLLTPWSC